MVLSLWDPRCRFSTRPQSSAFFRRREGLKVAGKRQRRPEDLQGNGSRYKGQQTVYLGSCDEGALVEAMEAMVANMERQFRASRPRQAMNRPRDGAGRFLRATEGQHDDAR